MAASVPIAKRKSECEECPAPAPKKQKGEAASSEAAAPEVKAGVEAPKSAPSLFVVSVATSADRAPDGVTWTVAAHRRVEFDAVREAVGAAWARGRGPHWARLQAAADFKQDIAPALRQTIVAQAFVFHSRAAADTALALLNHVRDAAKHDGAQELVDEVYYQTVHLLEF